MRRDFNRFMTPRCIQPLMMASQPDNESNQGGGGSGGEATHNNQTGNSNDSNNNGGENNNGGQSFDRNAFWNQPAGDNSNGGTNQNGGGGGGTQPVTDEQFQTGMMERLGRLTFGQAPVVTPEIAAQLAQGDHAGFNEAITGFGRQVTQQALGMALQVMQRFGDQMMGEVNNRMQTNFGSRDQESFLTENIPLYKNPASKPFVESVFAQSMKHAKGDRSKALQMTKDMLRGVGEDIVGQGEQLGFAPPTPGDSGGRGFNNDWIDRLVGAK